MYKIEFEVKMKKHYSAILPPSIGCVVSVTEMEARTNREINVISAPE